MFKFGFREKPKCFKISEEYLLDLFKEGGDADRYFGKEFNILNENQMELLGDSTLKPMLENFIKCHEIVLKE